MDKRHAWCVAVVWMFGMWSVGHARLAVNKDLMIRPNAWVSPDGIVKGPSIPNITNVEEKIRHAVDAHVKSSAQVADHCAPQCRVTLYGTVCRPAEQCQSLTGRSINDVADTTRQAWQDYFDIEDAQVKALEARLSDIHAEKDALARELSSARIQDQLLQDHHRLPENQDE